MHEKGKMPPIWLIHRLGWVGGLCNRYNQFLALALTSEFSLTESRCENTERSARQD
jgi:hypothetical protein